MEKNINPTIDVIRVFTNYTERMIKKNSEYQSHPLLKALLMAITLADQGKTGEVYAGLSQWDDKDKAKGVFMVSVKKTSTNVIEIIDIASPIGKMKELDFSDIEQLFRLQMKLDRLDKEYVDLKFLTDYVNSLYEKPVIYYLQDDWILARDHFADQMRLGKINLRMGDPLIKELPTITFDKDWKDYSPRLRSYIGTTYMSKINSETKNNYVICMTSADGKYDKLSSGDFLLKAKLQLKFLEDLKNGKKRKWEDLM